MSLTDNALRKLQRDGLFAVGPAAQPPAEPQQPPTTTNLPTDDDSTAPVSDPTGPLPSAESHPFDDAPGDVATRLPPPPTALTEPLSPEFQRRPATPAYNPVIHPFEDSASAPPSAYPYEADPHEAKPAAAHVPQATDEADPPQRPEEMDDWQDRDRQMPNLTEVWQPTPQDIASAAADVWDDRPATDLPDTLADHAAAVAAPAEENPLTGAEQLAPAEDDASAGTGDDPTKSSLAVEIEEPAVEPTVEVATAVSLPYEQLVMDRLSQPEHAEPFLSLQNTILRRCGSDLPASLLATSPQATARSAELVVHLSLIWAAADEEILMVDANLEEQTLTRRLDALGQPGLCDILAGTGSPSDLIRSTSQARLHFMPCGDDMVGISRDPQQLDAQLLQQVLEQWCGRYHRVLIDVGSIGTSLALPLAQLCEASLLVVCMQDVVQTQLQSAAATLLHNNRSVLGCVLTDLPR